MSDIKNLYNNLTNFYNVNDENFKEFMAKLYEEMLANHRDVKYVKEHLYEEIVKILDEYLVDGKIKVNIRQVVDEFLNNTVIEDINTDIKDINTNIEDLNSQLDTKTTELDNKINEVATTGTTTEAVQSKVEDMAEKGLIQAYTIGDGTIEYNKLSSDLVNSIYDTSVISDTKVDLIEVDTILNKKAYFNSTYKLMAFSNSANNNCCKIFNLKANKIYEIKAAGMNNEDTPLAVSCEQLITDINANCKYKDTFKGTSDVSILYEIFNYTPTVDCYIYVNGTDSYVKELKTSFDFLINNSLVSFSLLGFLLVLFFTRSSIPHLGQPLLYAKSYA